MVAINETAAREYTEGCIFRVLRDKAGTTLKYGDEVQLQVRKALDIVLYLISMS